MTTAAALMKQIAEVLADYDKKVLEGLVASVPARREAVEGVRARLDAGEFKGKYGTTQYAYAQIDAAGGKGWLELLRGLNVAIVESLTKTESAKAEARNAKIAAKLAKVEISNVAALESCHSNDGFNGRWSVETDKGTKHVILTVILAGGYNIQCLHHRVLVRVI